MSKQQKTSNISTFENLLQGFSDDIDGTLSEIQYCRNSLNKSNSSIRPAEPRSPGRNDENCDEYLQLREALKSAEDRISYLHRRNIELMAADTLRRNRCDSEILELQNRIKQLEKSSKRYDQSNFLFSTPDQSPITTKTISSRRSLNSKSVVSRQEELRISTAFGDTPKCGSNCLDSDGASFTGDGASFTSDVSLVGITPPSLERAELAVLYRNSKSQSQSQLYTPYPCPAFVSEKDADYLGCGSEVDEIPPKENLLALDTEFLNAKMLELQNIVESSGTKVQELQEKLELQIVENSRLEATLLDAIEVHKTQKVELNQMAIIRGQVALLHFEAEEYRIHITEQEKLIKNLSVIYLEKMSSDQ